MAARAIVLLGHFREIGQRFGEALTAGVGHPGVELGLLPQLLLEQRVQHDAPTPASASRRTPSTVWDSGEADATSGLPNSRPI